MSTAAADSLLQSLAADAYSPPLSGVRKEPDYPRLDNPLHLAILLIDCDTELEMQGMFGFLENSTGRYLSQTAEALSIIGAQRSATLLTEIESAMRRHGVTWERLRNGFSGRTEFEVVNSRELHGESLDAFASEAHQLAGGVSLFNSHTALEDAYGALCEYLASRMNTLRLEIETRKGTSHPGRIRG